MFGLLFFIVLTVFLVTRLSAVLGERTGYTIEKDKLPNFEDVDIEETSLSEKDKQLAYLQKADPTFSEPIFVNRARKAFEMIFSAYANEDKETLRALMAPRIFKAFSLAIDDRQKRGEKLEGTIVRFIQSEIVDAKFENGLCSIKIRFVTEQSDILKNTSGEVLEGDPNFVESRTDIWVFSREIASRDPSWYLSEITSE